MKKLTPYLLRPGDKFFLAYPTGFVPLLVQAQDRVFEYLYDPLIEGNLQPIPPSSSAILNGIRNLNFISDQEFGSQYITGNPVDVFRINEDTHLYQLFFGVAPSYTRVFYYFPSNTQQGSLDVGNWNSSYFQFGYIDGFDSPLNDPDPVSELAIPNGGDPAFTIVNPTTVALAPLFRFIVNRISVTKITDVNVIYDMFTSNSVRRIVVGGLSTIQTNPKLLYDSVLIDPSKVLGVSKENALSYLKAVIK